VTDITELFGIVKLILFVIRGVVCAMPFAINYDDWKVGFIPYRYFCKV